MDSQQEQRRMLALMVMLAFWLAAFGYSVVFLLSSQATGDGLTGGFDRFAGFLGWQGVAGMFAFAVWGVGRSFRENSGIRRISALPIVMAIALILLMVGVAVYTRA